MFLSQTIRINQYRLFGFLSVKERDAMTQPKTDLAYLRSEKAKAEQKLRYYKYREKILEHQIPELTS